jgi:hypothetical protein
VLGKSKEKAEEEVRMLQAMRGGLWWRCGGVAEQYVLSKTVNCLARGWTRSRLLPVDPHSLKRVSLLGDLPPA